MHPTINMRTTIVITISVVLFVMELFALWEISNSRTFQFFGAIVPRVNASEQVVALTFDDGPVPSGTGEILKVLGEMGVKATFIVIGSELEQNMLEGRKIVTAGHELGNHSYSHTPMVLVTPAFVQQEVEKTDRLIREAGYTGEICFRPPFGKKLLVLPYYLARTGRKTITWDVEPDSNPDNARDARKIIEIVRSRVRPGSIILLHAMYPRRRASLKAVRGIIESLRTDGYRFVTVSELLQTAKFEVANQHNAVNLMKGSSLLFALSPEIQKSMLLTWVDPATKMVNDSTIAVFSLTRRAGKPSLVDNTCRVNTTIGRSTVPGRQHVPSEYNHWSVDRPWSTTCAV